MIILTGRLRQSGRITIKDQERLKLWVEHETPRTDGPGDLRIEELLLPIQDRDHLPSEGEEVSVVVRPYPRGREIGFSAIRIIPS